MLELISISRAGVLGTVKYRDGKLEKAARFDSRWTDDKVLRTFGISKPAEPAKTEKGGKKS